MGIILSGQIQNDEANILILSGRRLPNILAGQHLGGAAPTNPNCEEDHQQGGGKHHLTGVRRRVPDGQGKGHRASQS